MSHRSHLRFCGALLATIVSACQAAPDGSARPPTSVPDASTAPGGSAEESLDAADPTALPGLVQGPGDVFLLDATDGLGDLASYRATLTDAFDGTSGGAASTWTSKATYSVVRDPQQYLRTIELPAGQLAPFAEWEAFADGAAYSRSDDACVASLPAEAEPADPGEDPVPRSARPRDPASQLPGFVGAEVSGTETVSGVATETATITPAALGWSNDVKASGSVAIAIDGGYVVRYDLVIDGGPDLLGEGRTGKLSRHYELTDIGTTTITIPAGCPAGLLQPPMPADAAVAESLPGFLTLTSKGSVVDTAALYRDTSLTFGWKAAGTPTINGDLGALSFTADGLVITVLVTAADGGGSRVEIVGTRT